MSLSSSHDTSAAASETGQGGEGGAPRRSAVDEIVQRLRGLIEEGGLKVGDRLPTERELCEQFSASRNTVREAMRILKAYGQVEVRPKIGATIADKRMARAFDLFSFNVIDIHRDTFSDVQAFRGMLEIGPVDILFDKLTEADIDALRSINAGLARASDTHAAAEIDFQFHLGLVSILNNNTIRDVYSVLKPVIIRIMEKGKTRRVFQTETFSEHEGVIDALEARDRLAFQYRLRTHLLRGVRYFEDPETGQA
jgi:GntR family transcriptional repressor for pyruvate dehydrogenase complex